MTEFEKMWSGKDSGVRRKIKASLKPKTQLRNRLESAVRALDLQSRKLDIAVVSLKEKDRLYYSKIVDALRMHDRSRAALYANELTEVRKALRSINQAKLAMEQISLRLGTVKEIGDIVVTLAPAMSVIKSVRGNLAEILPQADDEFNSISDMLSSILVDAGQMGGITLNFSTANDEAEKILKEAETHVEREMREKLPSVPSVPITTKGHEEIRF
ncbi:MAG: Snf7 family protein [Candidatus Geothermarchaeales archaeon]